MNDVILVKFLYEAFFHSLRSPSKEMGKALEVVQTLSKFSWRGSRLYAARSLKQILDAVPEAEVRFRQEMSGFFAVPSKETAEEFEQAMSSLGSSRRSWSCSRDGWLAVVPGSGIADRDTLRALSNFYVGSKPWHQPS